MNPKVITLALGIVLLFPLVNFAQTNRYVNPSGDDSGGNNCTDYGSPCQTIAYAITQALTGDVLKLSAGTFSSTTVSTRISIDGKGNSTIIQGLTIDAPVSGVDLVSISDVQIQSGSANGITIETSFISLEKVNSSGHTGRNINIEANANISTISISDSQFDDGGTSGYGLWINEDTGVDGLTILNSTFDNNRIGLYFQNGNSGVLNRVENVVIRNCTFSGNQDKGIYVEKLNDAVLENISVIGSGVSATNGSNIGIDINLKWQAYSNITIRNSRIEGCGALGINAIGIAPENRATSAVAIKARTDAPAYNGTPASLTDVTLDGVIIDGLVTDLRFGEMGKTDNEGIDMSTVTISHCHIMNDNLAGLLNEENINTLTISNNYWRNGVTPSGTDIEDYGSAVTSQTLHLDDLIVDELHNTYSSFSAALASVASGGIIQNIPAGNLNGTTNIDDDVTLVTPGAGLLDPANSLSNFAVRLRVRNGVLTLGSDFTSLIVELSNDVVMDDYHIEGTIVTIEDTNGSVQDAVDIINAGGILTMPDGTFTESVTISKAITLNGNNAGTPSNGGRGAETIIDPASGAVAIAIESSSVVIDGIQIGTDPANSNVTTGILSIENDNVTITNNVIYANAVGIDFSISEAGSSEISDNLVQMLNLVDPITTNTPSIGLNLQHVLAAADLDVIDNDFSTASYGIIGYSLTSASTVLIDGGNYTDCTKGIEIDNTDGINFNPSTVNIQNVVMSGFIGPGAGLVSGQPDTQAGIYAFVTGAATASDDIVIDMDNVDISDVGNGNTDYAAIYIADFQATGPFLGTVDDGVGVTATLTNSNIHDNLNRGIYSRGRNAVTIVTHSTLTGNGFNPFSSGAGGVVFARGTLNISGSTIINPATGTVDALLAQQNGTIVATNNSFDQNGNGELGDTQSGGSIDMTGNWLGATDETTLAAFFNLSGVDFTPWIGNGVDIDGGTPGFQADFSDLYVGLSGAQIGGGERTQEAHDLLTTGGTITLSLGDYNETLTVTKNMSLAPLSAGVNIVSLDNLLINAASQILQIDTDLRINTAVINTDGIIQVNSPGNLILGTGAADLSESASSYVDGSVLLDPRAIGTGALSMLGLDVAAGADDMGNIILTRTTGTDGIITTGANSSIAVNWVIDVDTEPSSGRDIEFSWRSPFDNGKDLNDMSLFKNSGSGWEEVAGPQIVVPAGDLRTYPTFNTTSFSDWTLAEDSAPLPVVLVSFAGVLENGVAQLHWITASEINSDYFKVERSRSGASDFEEVGKVGSHGNSNEQHSYSFIDMEFGASPIAYYRLKMVDFDGTYEYSQIIAVNIEIDEVSIFPNPTTGHLQITGIDPLQIENITVFDLTGRRQKVSYKNTLSNSFLDGGKLARGQYLLKIESVNGRVFDFRFIKD